MRCREINVVHCESHKERANTLCEQNAAYLNVTACGVTTSLNVNAVTLKVTEAQQPLDILSYLLDKIKICPKLCFCVEVHLCYGRISTKTGTEIPTQLTFYSRFFATIFYRVSQKYMHVLMENITGLLALEPQ